MLLSTYSPLTAPRFEPLMLNGWHFCDFCNISRHSRILIVRRDDRMNARIGKAEHTCIGEHVYKFWNILKPLASRNP